MSSSKPTWTDKAVNFLREKAAATWTAAKIAAGLAELGQTFSRNAVIGKAHRLGIGLHLPNKGWSRAANRDNSLPRKKRSPVKRNPGGAKQVRLGELLKSASAKSAPESRPGTLLDLKANDCRWPLDRDAAGKRLFCCASKMIGEYCLHHYVMSLRSNERTSNVAA